MLEKFKKKFFLKKKKKKFQFFFWNLKKTQKFKNDKKT